MKKPKIIIGISSFELSEAEIALLQSEHVSGVILFERNIASLAQVQLLIKSVKEINPPLKICIDHEGGRVNRFRGLSPYFPEAASYKSLSETKVRSIVNDNAQFLAELQIDTNFAPVVDVAYRDTHEVLKSRCYSDDVHQVAELSLIFVEQMKRHGIACVAKHFPGSGAIKQDPHLQSARVDLSLAELNNDLLPYKKLFAEGLAGVMSSHALYSCLDTKNIATFSLKIMCGLLREQLFFKGDIYSDDLEMAAVSLKNFKEVIGGGINSGVNYLLICKDIDLQRIAIEHLHQLTLL